MNHAYLDMGKRQTELLEDLLMSLQHCRSQEIPICVGMFRSGWYEEFDTEVPNIIDLIIATVEKKAIR